MGAGDIVQPVECLSRVHKFPELYKPKVLAQACNPSTWEVKAED